MEKEKLKELLEYEVAGSWLVPWVSWSWAQEILSEYYALRVTRKYRRWQRYKQVRNQSATDY